MLPYSADQSRFLIDSSQHYEQWIQCQRALTPYLGWMTWKTAKGNDYLYHGTGNGSNGQSLGRRNQETEAVLNDFTHNKAIATQNLSTIEARLKERAPILLSMKLGKLAFDFARVLRNYDTQEMLGPCLMVGGTHGILAYEVLSGQQLDGELASTEDLDFLWRLDHAFPNDKTELLLTQPNNDNHKTNDYKLLKHLKSVDKTFSVNTERSFQARNAKGFAIDFLATRISQNTTPSERLQPLRIKGQSWLLLYPAIEAIVIDSKGLPAKLICPDPRLYAIHKAWVSQLTDREKLKAPRDLKQAIAVTQLTAAHLPQFPFDAEFINSLPEELQQAWKTQLEKIARHTNNNQNDLMM